MGFHLHAVKFFVITQTIPNVRPFLWIPDILFLSIILLHEKFLQLDWLRELVFQLNLKYLHVKITNLLRVVL